MGFPLKKKQTLKYFFNHQIVNFFVFQKQKVYLWKLGAILLNMLLKIFPVESDSKLFAENFLICRFCRVYAKYSKDNAALEGDEPNCNAAWHTSVAKTVSSVSIQAKLRYIWCFNY